jgi:hypothetical protein
VSLAGHFLDRDEVGAELARAGFDTTARLDRGPSTPRELPSRRCYLLAVRPHGVAP